MSFPSNLVGRMQALLRDRVDSETALALLAEALILDVEVVCKSCCRVIAEHLHDFIGQPQLAELVHESAASIQDREDVDSIPIIDDIRFYINQCFPLSDSSAGWQSPPWIHSQVRWMACSDSGQINLALAFSGDPCCL